MKPRFIRLIVVFCMAAMLQNLAYASTKTATVRINSDVTHQKITGFGGFVNSPQFAYNHMSTAEIKKLWGKDSQMGYNIMRIFIPDNENNWSQAVTTAKLAKSLGVIVFASPWSMPAKWKTNNSTAGVADGKIGYLKEENYGDYADFLNRFVKIMRDNGVELDAISIQNEPDYDVTYSGCHWTPAQMAKFLKEHASSIDCKIMAPETVGLSTERYVDALIADDVVDKFDIYAGHQYGGVGDAHKKFREKGKEIWQSEFLINWNEIESNTRSFSWSLDAFNFAQAINICMLSDVNAWVHYASKRYYGMLGDGERGTRNGVITKRGYILSHYAKYATGTTRVEDIWNDSSNGLTGSSYLSVSGDSVIVVVINSSANSYSLTVDLPFYSKTGKCVTTTETSNMTETSVNMEEETCRPKVTIEASSVSTLVFTKSGERPVSQMTGERIHHGRIEDQTVTNASFGNGYQLSGKTAVLKNDTPLISANTTNRRGYLELNESYNRLVFEVESLSSTMNYSSSNTTLYYINDKGVGKSYDYGNINFDKRENFEWVLDISRNVLTDGCKGILGISNGNYTSVLTFKFGNVYFAIGDEKMHKFTGIYSHGDSDLLDCLDDVSFTSLDFTATTAIPATIDWNMMAINKNCVYYVNKEVVIDGVNVITGSSCNKLELKEAGGDFYAPVDFNAASANYTCTLNGYKSLVLPFEVTIPEGVNVYTFTTSDVDIYASLISGNKIPAHTPVLLKGKGEFVFEGTGEVSSAFSVSVNNMNGVYVGIKVPTNSYYLNTVGNVTSFHRAVRGEEPLISAFNVYMTPESNISVATLPLKVEGETSIGQIVDTTIIVEEEYYTLTGQRVYPNNDNMKGIYIVRRILSDGSVNSEKVYLH